MTIQPLGEVLNTIEHAPWNHALYLDAERPWTESTSTAILDHDDVDDPEEEPEFAVTNGLRYALLVSDVQDIVENAKEQKPHVTASDLVQAFNYYYDNDAFIEV